MESSARAPKLSGVTSCLKRQLRRAALLLAAGGAATAQESFRAEHASARYDALVRVERCGGAEQDHVETVCSGTGTVSLRRKGARAPFQTLRLPSVWFDKRSDADDPRERRPGRYSQEYGLLFRDFNFDGREDLAVCNGRGGVYGGPSYTVFLFNPRTRRFAESKSLTELADSAYFGLFDTDPKRRTLTVFSRSGCCSHQTDTYRLVRGRPVLFEQVREEAGLADDDGEGFVRVTERKRVGGRWVVKETRRREED